MKIRHFATISWTQLTGATTNALTMAYRVALIFDSRGLLLQQFFDQLNQWPSVTYQVITMRGKKLWNLWLVAKDLLINNRADRVYILGGICNLTSPVNMDGTRYYWPMKRVSNLAAELCQCQIDIYEDVMISNLKGKVILLPEYGGDLIRYNNIDVPSAWMSNFQSDLDENLPLVHKVTKDINRCMGVKTPWSLDIVYRFTKGGNRYPKYELLSDGVHFTERIASRLVVQILKDVDEFFEEGEKVMLLVILICLYIQEYYSTQIRKVLKQTQILSILGNNSETDYLLNYNENSSIPLLPIIKPISTFNVTLRTAICNLCLNTCVIGNRVDVKHSGQPCPAALQTRHATSGRSCHLMEDCATKFNDANRPDICAFDSYVQGDTNTDHKIIRNILSTLSLDVILDNFCNTKRPTNLLYKSTGDEMILIIIRILIYEGLVTRKKTWVTVKYTITLREFSSEPLHFWLLLVLLLHMYHILCQLELPLVSVDVKMLWKLYYKWIVSVNRYGHRRT